MFLQESHIYQLSDKTHHKKKIIFKKATCIAIDFNFCEVVGEVPGLGIIIFLPSLCSLGLLDSLSSCMDEAEKMNVCRLSGCGRKN